MDDAADPVDHLFRARREILHAGTDGVPVDLFEEVYKLLDRIDDASPDPVLVLLDPGRHLVRRLDQDRAELVVDGVGERN
ncbi:MAG: hypothetical protein EOQ66_01870 [Mesorhizobium sp.]|nr:MAG: hypothetical protein EOQ66_01870 [Mesorhizobium sp.]